MALLLPAAPALWWWWPDGGWLTLEPLGVRAPSGVPMPPWPFWVVQAVWAALCAGAVELLWRAPRTGAFAPACVGKWGLLQILGLITGRSVVWRRGIDRAVGAGVHWCYRRRRTCGCLGEIVLTLWLLGFALWPLAVPATCLGGDNSPGELAAWWGVAALAALFFTFHAVRIGGAYWHEEPFVSTA
mmetsp:Transcript_61045/g.189089  ORF Transcript_61045/g.189089 Transcript_61045/m.189089 type:complete len:186 (+) Transcript_61045:131-688(+)